MGMCKGCGQIFKTEDMVHNFCVDCQKTETYTKELELINNGTRQKERKLISRENWLIVLFISMPLAIFSLISGLYPFLKLTLPFAVISLYFVLKITYTTNKDKIKNKKEILVKSLIVFSAIWLLLIMPKPSYEMKQFVFDGIIPIVLIFGIVWIYFAYSKNKPIN